MQKEVNKLLKQLSAAKARGNHKDSIELNNIIGGLYSEIGSYDEAVHYHQQALDLSKTLGDRLNTALCHRYIGEAKASLGNYDEAIKHIKTYVELAEKIKDMVEVQRAWTTLGRIYLMQAQSLHEGEKSSAKEKEKKMIAREAERHFQTALNMAESVRGDIDEKEYCSMISGLLINMAILKDMRGLYQDAVVKFNRAAETCRSKKLKEDLYRCYAISGPIHRRWNDTKLAIKANEDALKIAKSIGKKILICEALIELGYTRICQRDFKNAKRAFAQAYLEKSPSEDDHIKAIKLTKLSHLIWITYEKLGKDSAASETRTKLCDKLGDLFVAIGNYRLAAEYYRQAYISAKACSVSKDEMARLLFSVAECYADAEQYEHALACFQKEATLRNHTPKEQSPTYIKIAHMMEYLNKTPEEICDQYEKALEKAQKDPKLIYNVLRWYVPFLERKTHNMNRFRELQEMLSNIKSYPEVSEEGEDEELESANELEDEIADVDDIITDDEDNDEVLMLGRRRTRGANKFKQNEVGDTPLHEASIKGDLKRVKSLISQGHEVNPRDNAGWIPLHESCNHGHYNIAEYLIEQGADVNNRGLKGVTPLHDAATNGHYDIMRLLIKNGANVLTLTDTGENVLTCLRDYKTRNYSNMSNSEVSEYKQMEAELLNIMDKCGHSLMSDTNTRPKAAPATGTNHKSANVSEVVHRRVPSFDSDESTTKRDVNIRTHSTGSNYSRQSIPSGITKAENPVRDYRQAMGTLKRKRPLEVSQASKKASQPATIQTNYDPSLSTKQWLLKDDDILEEDDEEEEEDMMIAAQRRGALKTQRCNTKDKNVIQKDDDEDVLFVDDERSPDANLNEFGRTTPDIEQQPSTVNILDDDFDATSRSSRTKEHFGEVNRNDVPTPATLDNVAALNFTQSSNFSATSTFDLFKKPLMITIGDRKLLVPIKDDSMTIRELKESIVNRYSILVNARPILSLAPKSDSTCSLFDDDLCKDVIREDLLAFVVSWNIPSIVDGYVQYCGKNSLQPIDYVKVEMRNLDNIGDKPDFSYIKFPPAHREAVAQALARRDFVTADFQGSVCLFEKLHTNALATNSSMMQSIITWNKLTRLNLKCTGLLRHQFEILCNNALPELQELDLSYNSIIYTELEDFSRQVENLHKSCPKMNHLNVSRNLLRFVDLFPELSLQKRINENIDVTL